MGDYHIADIYQGGYSSLNPNYGSLFTGYRSPIENIGVSTDPRTANILKEVAEKISPGEKVIELSLITPEILEAIPKQHLKEINRLSKLTGVEVTVHGPLIDASGVTDRGFDDKQREIAERKMLNAVERSHEINPDGNVPVTFHTANRLPGAIYNKKKENGREWEETESIMAVNRETGQFAPIKKEHKFYPTPHHDYEENMIPLEKGVTHSVEEQIRSINNTEWENSLFQVESYRENAERIMKDVHPVFVGKFLEVLQEHQKTNQPIDWNKEVSPEEYSQIKKIYTANEFLEQARLNLNSAFNKAYKFSSDNEQKYLKELAGQYSNNLGFQKDGGASVNVYNPFAQSEATFGMIKGLKDSRIIPELYKPAEEVAIEKSVKSFGNTAFNAYKKFGDKAPIINIENPPAGFGLSRGEDLKKLIEGSRKVFVDNAMKSREEEGLGLSKSQAEEQAKKLIGATWDVGHINQLRQFGFSGKDIIKEAEIVAPYVKHIHLSDNFGMENTELPMGMGNVDFKEVMEKLKEKGVNIDDTKKIVEAAHWWMHQQTNPLGVTFEALGSPIYGMHMGPYWNQIAGMQGGYFSGYGQTFPQINYETFGGGFSTLPTELGGQRQQRGGSRLGGTPME